MLTEDVHVQGTGSYREPESHPAATEDRGRGHGPLRLGRQRRARSDAVGGKRAFPAFAESNPVTSVGDSWSQPAVITASPWPLRPCPPLGCRRGWLPGLRQTYRTAHCPSARTGAGCKAQLGWPRRVRAPPSHRPLPSRFGQVHSSSVQSGPGAETTVRGNRNRRTLECFPNPGLQGWRGRAHGLKAPWREPSTKATPSATAFPGSVWRRQTCRDGRGCVAAKVRAWGAVTDGRHGDSFQGGKTVLRLDRGYGLVAQVCKPFSCAVKKTTRQHEIVEPILQMSKLSPLMPRGKAARHRGHGHTPGPTTGLGHIPGRQVALEDTGRDGHAELGPTQDHHRPDSASSLWKSVAEGRLGVQ